MIPAFSVSPHIATNLEAEIGRAMLKFHGLRGKPVPKRSNGQFGTMQFDGGKTSLQRVFDALTDEYQSGADISAITGMLQGTTDTALRKMRKTVQVDCVRCKTSSGARYLYRRLAAKGGA